MTLEECLNVTGLTDKEKGTIKATFGRKAELERELASLNAVED